MKRPSPKVVLTSLSVVGAVLTAQIWLPFVVFGSLYFETKLLGGRCGGSAVLHHIKRDSCVKSGSPVTAANVDKLIGDPPECPLLQAVQYTNFEAFSELLSKGAQPLRCSGYPEKFFDYLHDCKYRPDIAERFLAAYKVHRIFDTNPNQLLLAQAESTCVPGIRLAVELGANVNVEGPDGRAPLHYTTQYASEYSISATSVLVELGADPYRSTSKLEAPHTLAKRRLQSTGNWSRLDEALSRKNPK